MGAVSDLERQEKAIRSRLLADGYTPSGFSAVTPDGIRVEFLRRPRRAAYLITHHGHNGQLTAIDVAEGCERGNVDRWREGSHQ